jgi:hypothetical protein
MSRVSRWSGEPASSGAARLHGYSTGQMGNGGASPWSGGNLGGARCFCLDGMNWADASALGIDASALGREHRSGRLCREPGSQLESLRIEMSVYPAFDCSHPEWA